MSVNISVNSHKTAVNDANGLRIAGLTPYSSIDYPGCLSAVVWVQGCPWRCGYCHNPHLQSRSTPSQMSWDDVMVFLQKRAGLLDAVVFSGGEATTDRHLPAAMVAAKTLGYQIGLHTAGCYPDRLKAVLPLVDWLGLDVKADWQDYPGLTGVAGSGAAAQAALALVLDANIAYEVRTTAHPQWLPDQSLQQLQQDLAAKGVKHFALQLYRATGSVLADCPSALAADYPSSVQQGAVFQGFAVRD